MGQNLRYCTFLECLFFVCIWECKYNSFVFQVNKKSFALLNDLWPNISLKDCNFQSFSIHITCINIHLILFYFFFYLECTRMWKYSICTLKILREKKYIFNNTSFHRWCKIPNSLKNKSMHAIISYKFHIQHIHTKLQNKYINNRKKSGQKSYICFPSSQCVVS